MAYYPIMLNIKNKKCLVVGGGKVANRKIQALLECGGQVTVIAEELCNEVDVLYKKNKINVIKRNYVKGDIYGYFLAVSACDDSEINRLVAKEAHQHQILVNVVDNPELSSYIMPSVLRRQDLTVAVATGGKSPLLAKKIRHKLEEIIGEECGDLLEKLYKVREKIKYKDLSTEEKIKIYEDIINGGEENEFI